MYVAQQEWEIAKACLHTDGAGSCTLVVWWVGLRWERAVSLISPTYAGISIKQGAESQTLANKQSLWIREKVATHEKSSHKPMPQAGECSVSLGYLTLWAKKINARISPRL